MLFFVVVFLAVKNYEALTSPLELTPDKGEVKKETKPGPSPKLEVTKEPQSIVSYNSITEKNIFNPDRRISLPPGLRCLRNRWCDLRSFYSESPLQGTINLPLWAIPEDLLKMGEREQMTLKLGERIGEYKLAKISSDRVTLEREGDTFEVLLYDPKMPKKRIEVKTESKPITITSAQPSSTGASDFKREGEPPGSPSSTSPPIGTPRPPVRRGTMEVTKESVQGKTSPSEISEPVMPPLTSPTTPGPAPTQTQIPVPMAPTQITPPFTPTVTPFTPPPGMGKPVPLPPGVMTPPPSIGGK